MASSCSQVEFKDSARMTGRKYIDYTKVVRLNFKITFGELVCLSASAIRQAESKTVLTYETASFACARK